MINERQLALPVEAAQTNCLQENLCNLQSPHESPCGNGTPSAMKRRCDRCGLETEGSRFIFYEGTKQDEKHEFGTFCRDCTVELLGEMADGVEWFHIKDGLRGYIHPKARPELEKKGFIRPKHNTQYLQVTQIKGTQKKIKGRDALEILRVMYAAGLLSKQEYEKRLEALRKVNHTLL